MECTKCKKEIAVNSQFCSFCGSKIEKPREVDMDELMNTIKEIGLEVITMRGFIYADTKTSNKFVAYKKT